VEGDYILEGVDFLPRPARALAAETPVAGCFLGLSSPDLFGWPDALMGRLPGEQLAGLVARKMVGAGDRLRLAARPGDALAEVQALTWPVAVTFDPATGGVRPTTAFKPDLESLRSVAAVREPGSGWRLSGVFDLMGASFGDGEKALCRQLRGYLAEDPALAVAYVRAYFARRPPRPGVRERLALYLLADALTIWEWAHRSGRMRGRTAPALRAWLGGDERLAAVLTQALPAGA
jgi:hypothetical protein